MTLRGYIEEHYDVRNRIAELKKNPIKEFINSDPFPCDKIVVEDGQLVKMLVFEDGNREISVYDLLSYYRDEIVRIGDESLLKLYDIYTRNIIFEKVVTDSDLIAIRKASLKKNGFVNG